MKIIDIISIILVLAVFAGLLSFMNRYSSRLNQSYKEKARQLLKEPNPDVKELKKALRDLRLALGKSKDQEALKMIMDLLDRIDTLKG